MTARGSAYTIGLESLAGRGYVWAIRRRDTSLVFWLPMNDERTARQIVRQLTRRMR